MTKKIPWFFVIVGFLIIFFGYIGLNDRKLEKSIPGLQEISYPHNIRGIFKPIMWVSFPDSVSFIASENSNEFFLYKLNINSGKAEKVVSDFQIIDYVWSSDRSEVAFWPLYYANSIQRVRIFNVTQNSLQQIDKDLGPPYSWSPDKKRLVTHGVCESLRHDCSFLYDINKSHRETLSIDRNTLPFIDLSWSPDGEKVAFIFGDPFENKEVYGLYVMDLGSRKIEKVVILKDDEIRVSRPIWVRNGEWLAYILENQLGKFQLMFVNVRQNDCKKNPLPELPDIDSYDAYENQDDLFFVILDRNGRIFTLNLSEALTPLSLKQIFSCQ